jgi:heme exporter protein CcmD
MGGYALYVWGSILVVAGCMLGELIGLRMRRKAVDQLRMRPRAGQKSSMKGSK